MAMRPLCSLTALMLELLLGSGVGAGTVQVSPLRSIDTILSEADALMYENKRQMHAHHKES